MNFLNYTGGTSKCFQMKKTIKRCTVRKPFDAERKTTVLNVLHTQKGQGHRHIPRTPESKKEQVA